MFHRDDGRFETRNVLEGNPEIAGRLREEAERYLQSTPPWNQDIPTVELDEMELNQLRALGYSLP